MFDLNRDLIKEQSDIDVITMENYMEIVDRIINNKPVVMPSILNQQNLFE